MTDGCETLASQTPDLSGYKTAAGAAKALARFINEAFPPTAELVARVQTSDDREDFVVAADQLVATARLYRGSWRVEWHYAPMGWMRAASALRTYKSVDSYRMDGDDSRVFFENRRW